MSLRASYFTMIVVIAALTAGRTPVAQSGEIWIADRLTNGVYRYADDGTLLGTLLIDDTNLNEATGVVVSPDFTKLYVSSMQNHEVIQYDLDYVNKTVDTSTAVVFGTGAEGLALPNALKFSPDGTKLFVANLGGTGVAQFNLDGSVAGAPLTGGSSSAFSGLTYTKDGRLLAGGFDGGTVAISDAGLSSLSDLVASSPSIAGAAGLLRHGSDLYVSGLFATTVLQYDVNTGANIPTFGISGVNFPQGLLRNPDGSGFLLGVLETLPGTGNISAYNWGGQLIGEWAGNSVNGFHEATAFIRVPEPSSLGLAAFAMAALGFAAKRRRTS